MERSRKIGTKTVYVIMIAMFINGFLACHALYTYWLPMLRHGVARPKANVIILWEHAGGSDVLYTGNAITDIGEEHLRDMAANGGTLSAIRYISIGNATASTSLTDLANEYDRQAGNVVTWINNGDYAYNCTYKWTFSSTVTLNAAGLHWDASASNTLFAVANFAQTTFHANDNCTIRWIITFDGN